MVSLANVPICHKMILRRSNTSNHSQAMMVLCNFSGGIHYLTTRASIFLMMCLSVFRFIAIKKPTYFSNSNCIKVPVFESSESFEIELSKIKRLNHKIEVNTKYKKIPLNNEKSMTTWFTLELQAWRFTHGPTITGVVGSGWNCVGRHVINHISTLLLRNPIHLLPRRRALHVRNNL